jgi:hypothetical protein
MDDTVNRLLDLHRAFWRRDNERPLFHITSGTRVEDLQQLADPLPEGLLDPAAIAPRRLIRPFTEATRPGSDFFQPLAPPNMSWTEGMLGCTVWVTAGESTWARPIDPAWDPGRPLALREDNPWLNLLLGTLKAMVEAAEGRLPVAQPMMRGPADMAGSVLGQSRMCTDMLLEPDTLRTVLDQVTRLWIESYRRILEAVPPWHGGYCNVYGIWSPGTAMRQQEDDAALFSPTQYKEFLLRFDRLIAREAEYAVMHMHSNSLRFVDMILDAPEIRGVQVAVDMPPFGPPLDELVPVLRKVLLRKPLILLAYDPVSLEDAKRLVGPLSGQGLAVKINLATAHEANAFRAWLSR